MCVMYLFSGLQGVLGVDQAAGDQLALERVQLGDARHDDLLDLRHGQAGSVHPQERREAADVRAGLWAALLVEKYTRLVQPRLFATALLV